MRTSSIFWKFFLLILLLAAASLASLLAGAESIPLQTVFDIKHYDTFTTILIRDIRFSRTVLTLLTGALLAGAGCLFQGFFRNPLADPGIMGVSSGAALGAVTASCALATITAAAGSAVYAQFLIPGGAFIGAIAAVTTAYLIAGKNRANTNSVSLLLAGTALSAFFSAITSLILLTQYKELHKMYVWTLGSFNGKSWSEVIFMLILACISIPLYISCAPALDLLGTGETSAQSMGLNLKKSRPLIIGAASLGTAAAVAGAGTIGFIGLIAPHIARLLFGPRHRIMTFAGMLIGSLLLLCADIAARTVASPMELPVGIITALMGTPFFLYIMNVKGTDRI